MSKFIDNGNGTVTDTSTGLMWRQNHEKKRYTYEEAMALKSDFAGHNDWRLPTVEELSTIVDRSRLNPAIDVTAFPATPSTWFWSSSPFAGSSGYAAWYVNFDYGYVSLDNHNSDGAVRLVRAG